MSQDEQDNTASGGSAEQPSPQTSQADCAPANSAPNSEAADAFHLTAPVPAKAPDAYKSIGEVAAELGLQQHVLRFWESKFSQLRPLKRNGNRRFYRPDDVALIRCLRDLLHRDGYTIKGVQKLMKEQGRSSFIAAGHALGSGDDSEAALRAILGHPDPAPDGAASGSESDGATASPAQTQPPPPPAPKPGLSARAREDLHRLRDDLARLRDLLRAHL